MISDLKIDKSRKSSRRWSLSGSNTLNNTITEPEIENVYGSVKSTAYDYREKTAEFACTENPLDLAISGEGYFQVQLPNGEKAYTRDGMWKIGDDGRLVTIEGYALVPDVFIPGDALSVDVKPDGKVYSIILGTDIPIEIGQIRVAEFEHPGCLKLIGRNLYSADRSCGQVSLELPGTNAMGRIEQGFLELNQVNVTAETLNMMAALKCYAALSKDNDCCHTEDISEMFYG